MNMLVRKSHRWIAIAFVVVVVANFVALGLGYQAEWLTYLPLLPLFLLMVSGLYLFALPYVTRRRDRRPG